MSPNWRFSIGIASVAYGLLVLISGGERFYLGNVSATWGDYFLLASAVFFLLGGGFIFSYFRNRPDGETLKLMDIFKFTNDVVMCPKCGEPYNIPNVKNGMCPTCSVELEPVKGFYDRHPKFKD